MEHKKHSGLIKANFSASEVAPLEALVLAGGKSLRMGTDKGAIKWHNEKEQRYAMADILQDLGLKTYISCRDENQAASLNPDYQYIADTFLDLGPMSGILSAFRKNPNVAYLVVACDLPLLDEATIKELIAKRNNQKIATAFQSPENEFPEPLITIWEPQSYPALLSFLAKGYSCPRKVLINNEINLIQVSNKKALFNANTPEDKLVITQLSNDK